MIPKRKIDFEKKKESESIRKFGCDFIWLYHCLKASDLAII